LPLPVLGDAASETLASFARSILTALRTQLLAETGYAGVRSRPRRAPRRTLTDAQVAEVRASDLTGGQLARKYHLSRSQLNRIKRGLTR